MSRAWSWRHAIAASDLDKWTKLVLIMLSLKMDETGGGCYPPIAELVAMTGCTKNTVRSRLNDAQENGWLTVSKHGFKGQKWRRNEYQARWPERDLEAGHFDELTTDFDQQGGSPHDPPYGKKVGHPMTQGGSPHDPKVGHPVTQDKTLPVIPYIPESPFCAREANLENGFDEFWNVFSDKRGRAGALKVWKRDKLAAIAAEVIEGARQYVEARGCEPRFWKQAQGWLSGRRWEDLIPPQVVNGGSRGNSQQRPKTVAELAMQRAVNAERKGQ